MKTLLIICLLLSTAVLADEPSKMPPTATSLSSDEILLTKGEIDLVFLDALCPMPHFPGCEKAIADWAQGYRKGVHPAVAVFNALYVDEAVIKAFVRKHQLSMPVVVDADMTLYRALKIHATPYQVSLDNGVIVYRGSQLKLTKN